MAKQISAEYLHRQLEASKTRHKDYFKEGHRVTDIYEAENPDNIPFNILYSNTETMAPALYSATPRPIIRPRFKDDDKVSSAASLLGKRALEYYMDPGTEEYSPFDSLLRDSVLSALVPGRGITRFQFKADVEYDENEEPQSAENEEICGKVWPWDRFFFGYAEKWADVPWIAYQHDMTRDDMEENFGKEMADEVFAARGKSMSESAEKEDKETGEHKLSKDEETCPVYEIWWKKERKVCWIADGFMDKTLRQDDDPYGLVGFFDTPEPLVLTRRIKSLIPRPLYRFYENQAKELNSLTLRIQRIAKQIKVRMLYDSQISEELKNLLSLEYDGDMFPVQNPAIMAQQGALDKALWMFPVDKLAQTLVQLLQQRDNVKQTIYEITGISDILRGSTAASETATAQQIKNQWGTLRLKEMQKRVANYARGCLRLLLEMSVTKLSPQTLKKITNVPFPLMAEKQQLQMQLQQLQAAGQQAQAMGMPPPPPPPPQLQELANAPTIEELQQILADDKMRSFKLDIETNSTIDAEAADDKQQMAEVMSAIAQFMNGVGPLIEKGVFPFEVAKGLMLTIVRRYNMGYEVEQYLEKFQQPQQQQPDPEQIKKQQEEMTKKQQELQQMEQKLQEESMQLDLERKEFQMEQQLAKKELQMELQFAEKKQEFNLAKAELQLERTLGKAADDLERKSAAVEETEQQTVQTVETAMDRVQTEFRDVVTALSQAMEALRQAQLAPRTITDGKGRTLTVAASVPDNA